MQCKTTTTDEVISHIPPLSPITPRLAQCMVSNKSVLCVLVGSAQSSSQRRVLSFRLQLRGCVSLYKILIALVCESLSRIIHRVFPRGDNIWWSLDRAEILQLSHSPYWFHGPYCQTPQTVLPEQLSVLNISPAHGFVIVPVRWSSGYV